MEPLTSSARVEHLDSGVLFHQLLFLQSLTLIDDGSLTQLAATALRELVPIYLSRQFSSAQLLLFCDNLVSLPFPC